MEKSTPVRKPHTSTADLLTWLENSLENSHASPSSARSHQKLCFLPVIKSQKNVLCSCTFVIHEGSGAAGVYGAIRAKTIAPDLEVLVIEKGKPLSKVKISGGGRCNVTNGHCSDNVVRILKGIEQFSE
ncbi:hypothetical protein ACS0TY_016145 [Phlomoides rotata]